MLISLVWLGKVSCNLYAMLQPRCNTLGKNAEGFLELEATIM